MLTLAGFQDPILAAIWRQSERHDLLLKLPEGTDGHVLEIGSDTYIYFYQSVYGFGELVIDQDNCYALCNALRLVPGFDPGRG